MRLMLGRHNKPELLVDVADERDQQNFKFWVINGEWEGTYDHGSVTVHGENHTESTVINGVDIMCNEQDRLRGEYQTVFENYDNVNYVAPEEPKFELPPDWDDDIPF